LPDNAVRLRTFIALNNVKGDFVALFETLITVFLNRAEMDEHIFAAIVSKKAVALDIVEPLYCSFVLTHGIHLYEIIGSQAINSMVVPIRNAFS
jgi:hypothetical protein